MREELSIDMDMGEEDHPHMFFINFEELQELWGHIPPVECHRQQALLTNPNPRICDQNKI